MEDVLILYLFYGIPKQVGREVLLRMHNMFINSPDEIKDHEYFLEKTQLMNEYMLKQGWFEDTDDGYLHIFEVDQFQFRKYLQHKDDYNAYHPNVWLIYDLVPTLPSDLQLYGNSYLNFRKFQMRYLSNLMELDLLNYTSRQKANSMAIFSRFFDFATLKNANEDSIPGGGDPGYSGRSSYYVLQKYPEDKKDANLPIHNLIKEYNAELTVELSLGMRIFLILSIETYSSKLINLQDPNKRLDLIHNTEQALEIFEEILTEKYITEGEDSNSTKSIKHYEFDLELPIPKFRKAQDTDNDVDSVRDLNLNSKDYRILKNKIDLEHMYVEDLISADKRTNKSVYNKIVDELEEDSLKEDYADLLIDGRANYQYEYLPEIDEDQLKYEFYFRLRYYMAHFDRVTYFNKKEKFDLFLKFVDMLYSDDIARYPKAYKGFDSQNFKIDIKKYRYQDFVNYEFGKIVLDTNTRRIRELSLLKDSGGVKVRARAIQAPAKLSHNDMNLML